MMIDLKIETDRLLDETLDKLDELKASDWTYNGTAGEVGRLERLKSYYAGIAYLIADVRNLGNSTKAPLL